MTWRCVALRSVPFRSVALRVAGILEHDRVDAVLLCVVDQVRETRPVLHGVRPGNSRVAEHLYNLKPRSGSVRLDRSDLAVLTVPLKAGIVDAAGAHICQHPCISGLASDAPPHRHCGQQKSGLNQSLQMRVFLSFCRVCSALFLPKLHFRIVHIWGGMLCNAS